MKRWILLASVGMALTVIPTHAHHAISSAYDSSQAASLEGVIREFHFVYPHPFVTISVQKGDVQKSDGHWTLEMDNRSELARVGMTAETFKPGDWIVVTGSPSRGGRPSLYVRKLERPADGFQYEQVGRSPQIRIRP